MAKLTRYQRDAFIRAVMKDIPEIDYLEQFRKAVQADAYATLPPVIKAVVDADLAEFLDDFYYHHPGASCMSNVHHNHYEYKPSADVAAQFDELHRQHSEQRDARRAIEGKLRSAIYSCNTLKQARELLPELAHHLPVETTMTAQVPQVAGLVADLTKAGWKPKHL
jgi:hypothetical protein